MREPTKDMRLEDLPFDEFYIEEVDELYPNIKEALGKLKTKIKSRKRPHIHTGKIDDEPFNLSVHGIRSHHLRHTGI